MTKHNRHSMPGSLGFYTRLGKKNPVGLKKVMKTLLLLILMNTPCLLYAQKNEQELIDSLQLVIKKTRTDTTRANALNAISWQLMNRTEYDSAMESAKVALTISQKVNFKKGIAASYFRVGLIHSYLGNYPEALKNHLASLKIKEEMGDKAGIASSYNYIGGIYEEQGNYPEALKNYFVSLTKSEQTDNKREVASSYNNIANIYQAQGNYPQALKNYLKSLSIREERGDKKGIANSYNNIGIVYYSLENFNEALKNYRASLKISAEIGNKRGIGFSYNNIGVIYDEQGNYQEALKNYLASLKISEETDDKEGIATSFNNIGSIYYYQGHYADAMKQYIASLKIFEELGNKENIAISYNKIGNVYVKQKKMKEGKHWLEKSLQLAREIGSKEYIKNAYLGLSEADSSLGDYRSAYLHHKMYTLYRDSLTNEESNKKIVQQQMQYEFDKKEAVSKAIQEKKNQVARIERELQQKEINQQKLMRNSFIAGFVLILGFSVVVFGQKKKIEKGKRLSDNLLLNILPEEVANELKERGATTAKHFDAVSVLFTDFVDFTLVSERMTSQQLVEELHSCFKAFDGIISKYNIEKIKTIGDAYLAVCGLPVADEQHAGKIVSAALEINQFMQTRLKELGSKTFDIRIGIHSGSVVAGIVGVKKFAYDIWGDTVNTAARVEQGSEPGKINISGSTYDLVKHIYNCEYRGKIKAKNKGEIDMYFVTGKKIVADYLYATTVFENSTS